MTGGSSWAASGQGGRGEGTTSRKDACSDRKFSPASNDWFLFSRPLLLLGKCLDIIGG